MANIPLNSIKFPGLSDTYIIPDTDIVAETYSSGSTYAVGDYCIYNNALYRCSTAITTAEAWTAGHWTAVAMANEVSQLNAELTELEKATLISDTASGAIATFPDGAEGNASEVVASIEPVQDLHGYDSPWPAGGGVNKYDESTVTYGIWISADGTVVTNADYSCVSQKIDVPASTAFGIKCYGSQPYSFAVAEYQSDDTFITRHFWNSSSPETFTTDSNCSYVKVAVATYGDNTYPITPEILATYKVECVIASSFPTTYTPYSNVCPITGHTSCTVTRNDGTAGSNEITVTTQLGQTVYGGSLNVTTGVLTVNKAIFEKTTASMNNGENFPGWTASGIRELVGANVQVEANGILNVGKKYGINTNNTNDVFYLPKTGTGSYGLTETQWKAMDITVQFVVQLAEPQTYQLTPQEVSTLLGQNNIFADTGNVTVQYRADTKLYIDKKIAEALA